MEQDLGSILAYALYFIVLFAIGLYHMKDTGDMQSYMDRALPYEGHRRYAELHARRP